MRVMISVSVALSVPSHAAGARTRLWRTARTRPGLCGLEVRPGPPEHAAQSPRANDRMWIANSFQTTLTPNPETLVKYHDVIQHEETCF